jgi:hypothetical protein
MAKRQESTVTTGSTVENAGPLTRKVLEYAEAIRRLVPSAKAPADWAPLAEFVAVADFQRVGTFLEVQNWQQYTEMLTKWATATDSFETTLRRITEVGGLVFYEIEERHHRGGNVHVVNSMTVFQFDETGKIRHLDVYLQQPR